MKTYTYRITVNHQDGRVCILTRDIHAMHRALGLPESDYPAVESDRLLTADEMHALHQAIEPGAIVSVSHNACTELNAWAGACSLYPKATAGQLRSMGFWPRHRTFALSLTQSDR